MVLPCPPKSAIGMHRQRYDADLDCTSQLLVVSWHRDFYPRVRLCVEHDTILLGDDKNVAIFEERQQVETQVVLIKLRQSYPLIRSDVVFEALWLSCVSALQTSEAVNGTFGQLSRGWQENALVCHHFLRALREPGETSSFDIELCHDFSSNHVLCAL